MALTMPVDEEPSWAFRLDTQRGRLLATVLFLSKL